MLFFAKLFCTDYYTCFGHKQNMPVAIVGILAELGHLTYLTNQWLDKSDINYIVLVQYLELSISGCYTKLQVLGK